ncbi:MAG: hypothetical protein NXI27_01215 [Alphaproteobacteria bacterium]|nr:hypothetical protein [Alphaproteobacteria bacterium]
MADFTGVSDGHLLLRQAYVDDQTVGRVGVRGKERSDADKPRHEKGKDIGSTGSGCWLERKATGHQQSIPVDPSANHRLSTADIIAPSCPWRAPNTRLYFTLAHIPRRPFDRDQEHAALSVPQCTFAWIVAGLSARKPDPVFRQVCKQSGAIDAVRV